METQHLYAFGPFQVDSSKRILQRDQTTIPLPSKPFDVLLYLICHNHRLVKKDELMMALWPGTAVEENNLSQSISTIRKALGDSPHEPRFIETVPGLGFRFAAPVSIISQEGRMSANELQTLTRKAWTNNPLIVMAVVSVLVILAGSLYFFEQKRHEKSKFSGASQLSLSRRSIAVLSFDNLSQAKKDEWLSTGLSEMLSTELSTGGVLRIVPEHDIARVNKEINRANSTRGTTQKLNDIDQKLDPDLVVFGSYAIVGDQLKKKIRLDLRLKNAKTGEMIAEIADTDTDARLFDLISRIGVQLREKLGFPSLSSGEAVMMRAAVPDYRTVQHYSEGLERLRAFDAVSARDQLKKAVAINPSYPLAHAALADAYSALGYDHDAAREASRAFQLAKNLSPEEKLTIEGRYRVATRDWPKATVVYRSLVTLFPDDLDYGLQLAAAQTGMARGHDALATLDTLRHRTGTAGADPRIDIEASKAWSSIGNFKQMDRVLQEAVQKAQRLGHGLLLAKVREQQCRTWHVLGEKDKAIAACREAQGIYSAEGDRGAEADTLTLLGDVQSDSDVSSAMLLYRQSLAMHSEIGNLAGQATALNQIAIQYSNGGDHVRAANTFEQALAIFRRIDDQVTSAGMMINLSSEIASQGRLKQARKEYENTIDAATKLGNKDIQGLAVYDVAFIDQLLGHLEKASIEFQQASELFDEIQDKTQVTTAISGIGDIAMLKGDFKTAQGKYESALDIRRSTQQQVPTAESELDLAKLSVERGDSTAGLQTLVSGLLKVFHDGGTVDDEALATALLARILLEQGRQLEAEAMAEQALSVAAKADKHVRLAVAVTAARVRAYSNKNRVAQTMSQLRKTIADTRQLGFLGLELEARLVLGKLEMRSGAVALGRLHLRAVTRDASKSGFILVAQRAASSGA